MAFLLLLTMFWFVVQTGQPESIRITSAQTQWAQPDSGPPALQMTLTFDNPHAFEIRLTQVTYAVDLNDRRVSQGEATPGAEVPATGNRTVPIDVELDPDFPVRWWADHAASEEAMAVHIMGEAVFQVNQEARTVSFDQDWSWDSEWMGGWDDRVANCPPDDGPLCLAGSEHVWTGGGGVDSRLRFESDHNGTVTIDEVQASLVLERNEVATRTVRPGANLSEGDTADVAAALAPDDAALRAWWPSHVGTCERSDAAYRLDVTYTVTSTVITGTGNNTTEQVETRQETVEWEFPLPPLQTEIACEP